MQLVLPELSAPAKLILDGAEGFTEEEYLSFCEANSKLKFERTAKGEIVIVPPAGGESDYRSLEIGAELRAWAKKDGRGTAFGSSVEFLLPNGAALSPDAAWVAHDKLAGLSREQRRKFLRAAPDFVAEVMSPSDRLPDAQAKMKDWMDGGVSLAWLINGDTRTIYIYRQGREVEERTGMMKLAADGPIAGFVIDLADLWAGSDRF
jgi:Uma2 family endonuclease